MPEVDTMDNYQPPSESEDESSSLFHTARSLFLGHEFDSWAMEADTAPLPVCNTERLPGFSLSVDWSALAGGSRKVSPCPEMVTGCRPSLNWSQLAEASRTVNEVYSQELPPLNPLKGIDIEGLRACSAAVHKRRSRTRPGSVLRGDMPPDVYPQGSSGSYGSQRLWKTLNPPPSPLSFARHHSGSNSPTRPWPPSASRSSSQHSLRQREGPTPPATDLEIVLPLAELRVRPRATHRLPSPTSSVSSSRAMSRSLSRLSRYLPSPGGSTGNLDHTMPGDDCFGHSPFYDEKLAREAIESAHADRELITDFETACGTNERFTPSPLWQ